MHPFTNTNRKISQYLTLIICLLMLIIIILTFFRFFFYVVNICTNDVLPRDAVLMRRLLWPASVCPSVRSCACVSITSRLTVPSDHAS